MKKLELIQKLNRQGAVFIRPRHDEINEYTAKAILKKLF
jgi:hypothetical protein